MNVGDNKKVVSWNEKFVPFLNQICICYFICMKF